MLYQYIGLMSAYFAMWIFSFNLILILSSFFNPILILKVLKYFCPKDKDIVKSIVRRKFMIDVIMLAILVISFFLMTGFVNWIDKELKR